MDPGTPQVRRSAAGRLRQVGSRGTRDGAGCRPASRDCALELVTCSQARWDHDNCGKQTRRAPVFRHHVSHSKLFSPITLRDVTARNRVWVSPMCQYSAVDGVPNDWHLVHLGSLASGGAGLVFTEATAVVPEGRISPGGHRPLERRAGEAAGARIVDFLHAPGRGRRHPARARRPQGVDLRAVGRPRRGTVATADGGWTPVAPSARPLRGPTPGPRARSTSTASRAVVTAFGDSRPTRRRGRLRRGRDPRRARLPAARVPLAALQPRATTSTAAAREPRPPAARGGRRGPRPRARDGSPLARPHLRHRLGRGRLGHRADDRGSAGC